MNPCPWSIVGGTHDRDIVDAHGQHVATTTTAEEAQVVVAAVNDGPDPAPAGDRPDGPDLFTLNELLGQLVDQMGLRLSDDGLDDLTHTVAAHLADANPTRFHPIAGQVFGTPENLTSLRHPAEHPTSIEEMYRP